MFSYFLICVDIQIKVLYNFNVFFVVYINVCISNYFMLNSVLFEIV